MNIEVRVFDIHGNELELGDRVLVYNLVEKEDEQPCYEGILQWSDATMSMGVKVLDIFEGHAACSWASVSAYRLEAMQVRMQHIARTLRPVWESYSREGTDSPRPVIGVLEDMVHDLQLDRSKVNNLLHGLFDLEKLLANRILTLEYVESGKAESAHLQKLLEKVRACITDNMRVRRKAL